MKTKKFPIVLAALAVAGLVLNGSTTLAQVASAPSVGQPVAASAAAPQLAYGVPEILRLAQAKINDDTIIAYIKNSGTSYALSADQIIYLRHQGVSDAVIKTMLDQPKTYTATPASSAAAPSAPAQAVTYVQTLPVTTCYYAQPYYYPSYAWYPPVTLSFGWGCGGGWHWGGGWHGGWHH